jgi:hypothetical protein
LGLVLAASWAVATPASAQDGLAENLRVIFDTTFSTVTTTTTNTATGATTTTDSTLTTPRLNLQSETLLLPSLRLTAGGVFDVDFTNASTGNQSLRSSITEFRPYVEVRSINPVLSPGFGYHRRQTWARVAGLAGASLVNEDYAAYLGWRPEGLFVTNAQFVRTNTFDGDRVFQDTTKDFTSVITRYSGVSLNAYYSFTALDNEDRLANFETRQITNAARLAHSKSFWNRRVQWNGTYNINRQDIRTLASGDGGEVEVPVLSFTGLSALSDTPLTGPLAENTPLADGTFTASAGVNLGLVPPGGDTRARNLGLDFLNPTEVDRLYVWVDREIPVDIASTYSWEVYSSRDNITWTREATVPTAPFGPFENRFRLDFPAVTARYLKVVTRPLSPALPDATRWPDIFVVELQSYLVQSASEAADRLTRTNQTINADLRVRLMDTRELYYEGSYWYTGATQGGPIRETLSNGVSITHRFNRVWSTYARAAHEQGRQVEGQRRANVANATLTFTPIPTVTSSILYTGQDEEIGGRPNDRQSLYLQTNTQVYRGVDVLVGVGANRQTRETGERLRDRVLTLNATVVPRQNVTLTVNFADIATVRSGPEPGPTDSTTRTGYFTLAFDPLRTLHLVVGEELVAVTGEQTRTTTNFSVNWSPFPDGALQFIASYNEALRPVYFGSERNTRYGVRWALERNSYLDVSYQRIGSELGFEEIDSKIFSVDLKLFF